MNQILWTSLIVCIALCIIGFLQQDPSDKDTSLKTKPVVKRPVDCICECPEDNDEESQGFDKEEQGKKGCTAWMKTNNKNWMPHKMLPAIGTKKYTAARSCVEIRYVLENECSGPPRSDKYWLKLPENGYLFPVYCEMSLDGGGWTLVWKHSYMEVGPLSEDMKYFSKHYRPCTDIETGWCNVPYKARLNPTEMMIVAYRNKVARVAYKGEFNYDIDHEWSGGILVEPKKILDQCTWTAHTAGIAPAPSAHEGDRRLLGIAFDKHSPTNYLSNCDTIGGQFSGPWDCRWGDCDTRDSIYAKTQMTMAIYVR